MLRRNEKENTMKKWVVFAVMLWAAFSAAPFALAYTETSQATFEDLTLDPGSYWNGPADETLDPGDYVPTGFISGDFWHTTQKGRDATYDYIYWSGFAYSNRTDNTQTGLGGQYTAMPESGVAGSSNYGIGYVAYEGSTQIYFGYESGDYAQTVDGTYVTNNAYAYHSMKNGDAFAKKFGYGFFDNNNPGDWDNPDGTDPDWFMLSVYGLDSSYYRTGTSVDFYLADYRFASNEDDYIVDEWTWLNLSSLGEVYGLDFELTSSDVGGWGMNTPAYFAVDNVPIPGAFWLLGSGLLGLVGIRRRKK
jgi:hypothetical protein